MAQTHQPPNRDQQALALIQSSGILNPNTTLDKVMEISGKLSEMKDEAPNIRVSFILRFFCYKVVD
jgi:hypothetical protein